MGGLKTAFAQSQKSSKDEVLGPIKLQRQRNAVPWVTDKKAL